MKVFRVYKARLNYGNVNKFVADVMANDIEELKLKLKTEFKLNPFYAVILDDQNNVIQNEHLPLLTNHI